MISERGRVHSAEARVDRLFLVAVGEHDRQRDMVGIARDDLAEPERLEIFVVALAHMQRDARAARHVGGRLDVNCPCPSETQRQPSLSPALRLKTSTLSATMKAE